MSVIEAFQTTKEIHGRMDVSLRHILATPRGKLVSHEIGSICREVGAVALTIFVLTPELGDPRTPLSTQGFAPLLWSN